MIKIEVNEHFRGKNEMAYVLWSEILHRAAKAYSRFQISRRSDDNSRVVSLSRFGNLPSKIQKKFKF